MANTKKQDILGSITESFKVKTNFALIRFEKATHQSLEKLRRQLKANNATMHVVKNTIFEKTINKMSEKQQSLRAVRKSHFPLKEKSALLVFSGDWAQALKTYFTFAKDNETLSFKFGLLDDAIYGKDDLVKLAQLPGRQELAAKLIGTMKNPMMRTTRALKYPMQQLVYILSQKARQ